MNRDKTATLVDFFHSTYIPELGEFDSSEQPTNASQISIITIEPFRCLRALKRDKLPGPDGIPFSLLQEMPAEMNLPLGLLFQ